MGRELRKVPKNWEHPKNERGGYQPMYDENYTEAADNWIKNCMSWADGTHESKNEEWAKDCKYYWEYEGIPPDEDFYRPYEDKDAIWFQVYETVSEGTPVTPAFETKEELVDYLVRNGDFWDQRRGNGGYSKEAAEKFVMSSGWAPSFVCDSSGIKSGIEALA